METKLDCGHPESPHSDFTRGYGEDSDGKKHCYDCCAKRDLADMQETGRAVLYVVEHDNLRHPKPHTQYATKFEVTNWPGTFRQNVLYTTTGYHNIARTRRDVWFRVPSDPFLWHGVQYGDNTQLCHCKRTKTQ